MKTIRRLVGGNAQRLARGKKRLPTLKARAAIKAKAGVGRPSAAAQSSSAGGIASPLTEQAATRTFFSATRELNSSDGLFTLQYQNVRQITTRDALSRELKIIFDDPDSW